MKRWILAALVIASLAGCVNKSRKQAYGRWYKTRAKMLYGVAKEHLRVGQLDKARNKAAEALTLAPKFSAAGILLSKVYIEQGHYDRAEAELTELRKRHPDSAEVVYLLGVALEKQGQLDRALVCYKQAHALDTSNLSAVAAGAEVLVALDRIEQAERYIADYLGQADGEPGLYELAGRIAVMRKQYPQAVKYFQKARDIDYDNPRYAEALGAAQFNSRLPREALETLGGLISRKEYTAGAWVHTMMGDCYMTLGQPYKARDAYYLARNINRDDPNVWVNIAKAALALNDVPRAILSAGQALSLDPLSLEASILLAYGQIRNGNPRDAIKVLSRAAAANPPNGTLQCLLGRAFYAAGDEASGRRYYLAALRIEPDSKLARKLLAAAGGAEGSADGDKTAPWKIRRQP